VANADKLPKSAQEVLTGAPAAAPVSAATTTSPTVKK